MLTWAIAYAVTYGASQNWFWLSMPLDFLLIVVAMQTVKDRAKARAIEVATSPLFTKVCND